MDEGYGGQKRNLPKSGVVLLCMYCFFLQFTPSEPYLVPFLTRVKHLNNDDVTTKIFPVSVYCTLIFTLLAAPACSFLKYRYVILIGTLGRLTTFLILLVGKSLLSMQFMQVTYALGLATDIVFSSYLFVLVKEDMFQSLTSFTQASSTFSFLIAAELSQLLVSSGFHLMTLIYISTFTVGLAFVICIFIPKDKKHWISYEIPYDVETRPIFTSVHDMLNMIKTTWHKPSLKMLSLWWALQVGGTSMIENYGTNLFEAIDPSSPYNGHVIAATQGASCLAALVAVPVSHHIAKAGSFLYVAGSGVTWLLCIVMVRFNVLWAAYIAYVLCIAVNKFLVCVLYVQCAQLLMHGHYIFLFSLNAVAALLVQCLLQASVEVLDATVLKQFYYIGNYFLFVVLVSFVLSVIYFTRTGKLRLIPLTEEEIL